MPAVHGALVAQCANGGATRPAEGRVGVAQADPRSGRPPRGVGERRGGGAEAGGDEAWPGGGDHAGG